MLIVSGPSGSGKTTIGQALADRLGWDFEDADDYHGPEAKQKMAAGIGLTDADRAPWLDRLAALVRDRAEAGPRTVLACSALKRRYRDRLLVPGASLVWLSVPAETLRQRLGSRDEHFADERLLATQLEDAEPPAPPESARVIDGSLPLGTIVGRLREWLA